MVTKNVQKPKTEKSDRRKDKSNKICKGMMVNILISIYFTMRYYLDKLIDYAFSLYWDEYRQQLPNLDKKHALLMESAVKLAKKIRKKELKSEDLVTACIERIKQVNPILNAVTDQRFEEALKEAREIDKKIEDGLPDEEFKNKPFLGVPFTAKESHAVKGMLHTLGVRARCDVRAEYDAECVRLLKEAGALPLAVTNVPEINKWQETRNTVFGQTNNPYDTGRTVGGSSGGEAALHAALASPISLCSDIGGSTRMPAFYCGLYGYNPTAGHTSLKGSALRSGKDPTIASIGFVCKHPEDLAPLTKIVAGEKAGLLDLDRKVDIKDIKFFYVEDVKDLRISPVCSELKKAMHTVTSKLSKVSEAPKPYAHEGFSHCFALWKHAMTRETEDFAKLLTNNKGRAYGVIELGKKIIGQSDFTLAAILKLLDEQVFPAVPPAWADQLTDSLRDDLITLLGDTGVLIFPSAPSPCRPHYTLYTGPFNFALWGIFNALKFPAVQVPVGLSAGLPVGVQLVAAPGRDVLLLNVAAYLEEHLGGFTPPCAVPLNNA